MGTMPSSAVVSAMSQNWSVYKERANWRTGLLFFLWPLIASWQEDVLLSPITPGLPLSDRALIGRL